MRRTVSIAVVVLLLILLGWAIYLIFNIANLELLKWSGPPAKLLDFDSVPVLGCQKGDPNYVIIQQSLKLLHPKVRWSIRAIEVNDDPAHYHGDDDILAHCEGYINRICFRSSSLRNYPTVVFHEAGHAYHNFLQKSKSNFDERWKSIKGGEILSDLHLNERVSYWFEDIYNINFGRSSLVILDATLTKNPWPYYQRLDLLKEYEFITEEVYKKVLETIKKKRKALWGEVDSLEKNVHEGRFFVCYCHGYGHDHSI